MLKPHPPSPLGEKETDCFLIVATTRAFLICRSRVTPSGTDLAPTEPQRETADDGSDCAHRLWVRPGRLQCRARGGHSNSPAKVGIVKATKLATLVSKGTFPLTPGSGNDLTVNGAEVDIFDTASGGGGSFTHILDKSGWKALPECRHRESEAVHPTINARVGGSAQS